MRTVEQDNPLRLGAALQIIITLLLLSGLVALLVGVRAGLGARTPPPTEQLTVDQISLPASNQMVVEVTNVGLNPVTVVQVMVDDSYWNFSMSPSLRVPHLGQATITIPYLWVQGEPNVVTLVSSSGETFVGRVALATRSPAQTSEAAAFGLYALLGMYAGFIPVSLGLLCYPFLRKLGHSGTRAMLSLALGVQLFLLFNIGAKALEIIAATPEVFGGVPLVFLVALLTFGALIAVGSGSQGLGISTLDVAYRIALGIGLHNLGGGLAIRAAFALDDAALGIFLVVGFTLYNLAEGARIAAAIAHDRRSWHVVRLAMIAGLPAALGIWIGGYVDGTLLAALFLAVGAGAIAQATYETGRRMVRQSQAEGVPLISPAALGGLAAGIALMYATALLIRA